MKNLNFSILLLCLITLFCVGVSLASCNVTRVITNESSYFQRGDTTVTITTKTIESYEGTKK